MDAQVAGAESGPRERAVKRFCISVDSPPESAVLASGRWTVEAETREHALARVLPFVSPKWWPPGSAWQVCELCQACPYGTISPGMGGAIHRHQR